MTYAVNYNVYVFTHAVTLTVNYWKKWLKPVNYWKKWLKPVNYWKKWLKPVNYWKKWLKPAYTRQFYACVYCCCFVCIFLWWIGGWEVYCLHIMVWIFKHILFSCQQFISQDCVKSSVFFSSWFMTLLVQLKLAWWLVGLQFDVCHRTTMTFAWLLAV